MPVHDWTRVEDGIFHGFHTMWISELNKSLNEGLLPSGYYAWPEQHTGLGIADILTLHVSPPSAPCPPATGGTLLTEAPPRVRRRHTIQDEIRAARRSIAVRHVSGHRLIALLEILSPANKDRARLVAEFADKAAAALEAGVHLLLVDLFPPGRHDPHGMYGAVCHELGQSDEPYDAPAGEPLTLASFAAGSPVEVYLEYVAVGAALPEMPLFLDPERYINAPLEATYQAAYRGTPAFWRDVLEGRPPQAS